MIDLKAAVLVERLLSQVLLIPNFDRFLQELGLATWSLIVTRIVVFDNLTQLIIILGFA